MRSLAVTFGLIALTTLCRPIWADDAPPPMRLQVRPLLCIVDQFTPSCSMRFAVRWQSVRPGHFCLNNDLQRTPMHCWRQTDNGDFREQRVVSHDFSYWMSEPAESARLAAVKVEVLRIGSADRRRERRTRHIWDVL